MYEERKKVGTHVIKCDSVECHMDVLAESAEVAKEDAAALGWKFIERNGEELHQCPSCAKGVHPGEAVMRHKLGGKDYFETDAPVAVKAGEECRDYDGSLVGVAMNDAEVGQRVQIRVPMPTPVLRGETKPDERQESAPGEESVESAIERIAASNPQLANALKDADDLFGAGMGNWDDE